MLALLISLLSAAIPMHRFDPPDPPVVGISEEDFGSSNISFTNYKCKSFSTCPSNIIISDADGNPVGCVVELSLEMVACSGSCYTCAGGTCTFVPPSRIVNCGLQQKRTNGCTATQPAGVPQTPNGCYCDLTIGVINLLAPCSMVECQ